MHPIERLRWVARAPEGDATVVAVEAAEALAAFAGEPAGLVTACRRLIDRRPSCGPLWWLSSRVLCAIDPVAEAYLAAADLERDPTPAFLASELPGGAVVLGPSAEQAALAVRARARTGLEPGGVQVRVVDGSGAGRRVLRSVVAAGMDVRLVARPGKAVRQASVVLLEAHAAGPGGAVAGPGEAVAAPGSAALARAAREAGCRVWLVAGAGRVLPGALYDALARRLPPSAVEALPLDLVDVVAGPGGVSAPGVATRRGGCPVAAELLRFPH